MLKALEMLDSIIETFYNKESEDIQIVRKELTALTILVKWYKPWIIHDLCCFGASDEEIALVKEILHE